MLRHGRCGSVAIFRICCRTASSIRLQHHAEPTRQRRVQGDGEIQADHVAGFGQIFQWREGLGSPGVGGMMEAWRHGQNARWTAGFSSNSDRNTTTPSTMEALTLPSSCVHVW
jgi:hypothetical protein